MSREAVLGLLLVLGAAAVFFTWAIVRANRIERAAVQAAQLLLPRHTREPLGHSFTGQAHGVELTLRLAQGSGEEGSLWTEVHVPLPPGVSFELRPQRGIEAHMAERGLARDEVVGNAAFDAAFVVEAAPAAAARAVLDDALRGHLLELFPVSVVTKPEGGLRLEKPAWEESRFGALIDVAATLSARLHEVAGERVDPWDASVGAVTAASAGAVELAEIEALRTLRTRREAYRVRAALLVVVVLLVILVLSILLRQ